MQKFETPAPISAVLDIPSGRIRLIAAERADATVEVLPADASKSRDVKLAEQTKVEFANGVLRIGTGPAKNRMLGSSGSLEVTVQLPAGSRVETKTANAEFRGVGRFGEVVFEGAQGSVKVDEAAGGRLTLLSGEVTIGRLRGPARIETEKGDITITEAMRGTVVLRTKAGNLTVGAAQGVSAALDAGTTYGWIHNALRNPEGAPGLTIEATTAYGDITARSL